MANSQGASHVGQVRSFSRGAWDRMYEELYGDHHEAARPADWFERIYAEEAHAEEQPAAEHASSFYDDMYAGPSAPVVTEGPLDLARHKDEAPAKKAPAKRRAAAKKPAAKKRSPKKTHH